MVYENWCRWVKSLKVGLVSFLLLKSTYDLSLSSAKLWYQLYNALSTTWLFYYVSMVTGLIIPSSYWMASGQWHHSSHRLCIWICQPFLWKLVSARLVLKCSSFTYNKTPHKLLFRHFYHHLKVKTDLSLSQQISEVSINFYFALRISFIYVCFENQLMFT